MSDEYHPELRDSEPDDERPLRHPAMQHVVRVIVVIGILALIVPGVVFSIITANNTAQVACRLVVAEKAPDSVSSEPRFELLGADGPGWYCYARDFDGTETMLQALGLIPEVRWVPADNGVGV
jgi:hypothetical protein